MRYLAILALLLGLAAPSYAQQATLTTPETVAATKLVVIEINVARDNAGATVQFQTSADAVKRTATFGTSSQAELVSFVTAMGTARSGETGGALRRMQFRVLGWLVDNGKLKDEAGQSIAVTLVP